MKLLEIFFTELLGTFIFLSVIIVTGSPLFIGLTLAFVIYLGKSISGGHYNPAVTFLFWMQGDLGNLRTSIELTAQYLGAVGAYLLYNNMSKQLIKDIRSCYLISIL